MYLSRHLSGAWITEFSCGFLPARSLTYLFKRELGHFDLYEQIAVRYEFNSYATLKRLFGSLRRPAGILDNGSGCTAAMTTRPSLWRVQPDSAHHEER